MAVKAERIISDLFRAYVLEPAILPNHVQEWTKERGWNARSVIILRYDRPVCSGRISKAFRSGDETLIGRTMGQEIYLTSEGAARLQIELEELKGPKRDEMAKRLRSAIQMGDLSENADYHKAKEDQGFMEGRIQELEYILKNAGSSMIAMSKPIPSSGVDRHSPGSGLPGGDVLPGGGDGGRSTKRQNIE